MPIRSDKTVRYHFTAPASDTQIAEWVANQHNFSVSMRMVLKDYIARHGMTDASCLPLQFASDVVPISNANSTVVNESIDEPVISVKNESEPEVKEEAKTEAKSEIEAEQAAIPEEKPKNSAAADMLADMLS